MDFRALIGTVVSNGIVVVKFDELIYSTQKQEEIDALLGAWIEVYWATKVAEPEIETVEEVVEIETKEVVETPSEEEIETVEEVEEPKEKKRGRPSSK